LLAAETRSGVVEAAHEGAVAVVGRDGDLIAWSGDIDRPFFLRSAAKPFQAATAQAEGALLRPIELAVAASSHDGDPVHIAIVEMMLQSVGLTPADLQCPVAWPLGRSARDRIIRDGHRVGQRLWHDCSGKHASWLRACRAQGWDISTYLRPGHELQQRITEVIAELGEVKPVPAGVDGCGAPVHRTTTRAMALLYARLGSYSELRQVFLAMHRYPALVSGTGNGDTSIAIAIDAAAKRGAMGCLGVAVEGGPGIAVKAWDGSGRAADVAALATLETLKMLPAASSGELEALARPEVIGGSHVVGYVEPRLELKHS
jgi:L-asparaginase II